MGMQARTHQVRTVDDISKPGGEWGGDWNVAGRRKLWTWEATTTASTSEICWEAPAQGSPEDVLASDIEIWVL
jgi:hypothetical protein